MNKFVLYFILIVLMAGGVWIFTSKDGFLGGGKVAPSDEQAEITGFNFMLDFVKIAPPESDPEAVERVYEALSLNAKKLVAEETFVRDMALFVGVQDVPDGGVSVEDLQITGENTATLVLGLNYSGGRTMKNVNLVVEDGKWKVESVSANKDVSVDLSLLEVPAVIEAIAFAAEEAEVLESEVGPVSAVEREWSDGCLGLAGPDEMCTQAIVPGYEITLIVAGETRAFRTNNDGSVIRGE